jgi:hypothetical protein
MPRIAQLALAGLLAGVVQTAPAATFTVTNTNNSGAGSLRQALLDANAAPNPPHAIVFGAAFPTSGVITLQSALPVWTNGQLAISGNARNPIIDGASTYPILVVGSGVPSVSLSSLTFRNGRRSNGQGGCVALLNEGQATGLAVSFSRFESCVASAAGSPRGGAVWWEAGTGAGVSIIGSEFVQNRTLAIPAPPAISGGSGGALRVAGSVITLEANRFTGNFIDVGTATSGGMGGAVSALLHPPGVGEIIANEFRANSATPLTTDGLGLGGALAFSCGGECQWFIERNYFRGNSARRGGALQGPGSFGGSASAKWVNLINNTFVNNDVLERGGAVHLQLGTPRLFFNSFLGNGASAGSHLALLDTPDAWIVGNLMAAQDRNSACDGSGVTSPAFQLNLSRQPCALVTAGDFIGYPAMPDPVIDESDVLGVLRFDGDTVIVDGVSGPAAAVCPSTDIRGTLRPGDGDGDGLARCDVGAFEHPAETLFRNGFEP